MSSASGVDQELSRDLIFDLLSSPRRRMALYYLRERGGSSTVTELAEDIASLEYEVPVEELSRQQRKRVYVSLYQTHIPKLDEAGIVEYDDDTSEVTLTDRARRIDTYLSADEGDSYPWHYHYLALAVLSAGLFVGAAVVDGPIGPLAVGLVVTTAFVLSGVVQLVHRWYRQRDPPQELSEESLT
jgi:DNA-binding transcriptional ArsR family regulator